MDFLKLLQQVGFEDAELVSETGFNSSPKTKGVLIRARKTERLNAWKEEKKQIETKIEIKHKSEDIKSGSG
jgi:hypothetical protein